MADPDGRIRKVTYTADAVNGFQAVVTYDGEAGPPAIPIDTPAAVAAPVAKSSTPIAGLVTVPTNPQPRPVKKPVIPSLATPMYVSLAEIIVRN